MQPFKSKLLKIAYSKFSGPYFTLTADGSTVKKQVSYINITVDTTPIEMKLDLALRYGEL